jgi:hypothetical protein
MGFREKNAWVCGLSILLVFTPYFCFVLPHPMAHVALFVVAVFCLSAMLVGFHIVNAIATPTIRKSGDVPAADELDQFIELRAAKLAAIVLALVVLTWTIGAMVGVPIQGVSNVVASQSQNPLNNSRFTMPVSEALFWVHLLFAGFVLSNIVYYARIVIEYRRLSNG